MSNPDEPKKPPSSDDTSTRARALSGAGRSGSAGSIGKELGGDLDFDADDMLDSLLSDHTPAVPPAAAGKPAPPPAAAPAAASAPEPPPVEESAPTPPARLAAVAKPAAAPIAARSMSPSIPRPGIPRPASPPRPTLSRPAGVPRPATHDEPPPAPPAKSTATPVAPAPFAPEPPTVNRTLIGVPAVGAPPVAAPADVDVQQVAFEELDDDFEQLEFESGFDDAPQPAAHAEPKPKAGPAPDSDDEIDALLDSAQPPSDFKPAPRFDSDEAPPPTVRRPPPVDATTAEPPAVNPPGPPPRQPFPPAATPAPSSVEPRDWDDEDDGTAGLDTSPFLNDAARSPVDEAFARTMAAPTAVEPRRFAPAPSGGIPDERPAAAHLSEHAARDAWVARAEWFEHEAAATEEAQAKARLFLAASELWAMVDDVERARAAVAHAHTSAPANAVASRQQRWLAAVAGDHKTAAGVLEFETRASPTAEARVHAAYLSSDLHRVALNDAANAKKKVDLALRAKPDDARAHVAKWIEELIKGDSVKHSAGEDAAALDALTQAVAAAVALRGTDDGVRSPAVAFESARRALVAGKPVDAAEQVLALADVPELESAALWLGAQLLAPVAAARSRAVAALGRLRERNPDRTIERVLVRRALEQGELTAVKTALESPKAGDIFSPAERVTLGALVGLGQRELVVPLSDLFENPALAPIGAATLAALSDAPPAFAPGSDETKAEIVLGQSIAALRSGGEARTETVALRSAAERFTSSHPNHPLTRVLNLEFAVADRDAARVADQLSEWPADAGQKDAERDRLLAAGLVHELGNERLTARTAYSGAFAVDSECEAATRALLNDAAPEQASALLAELAESVTDRSRAALLWCEAALRRGFSDVEEYDGLLAKAADAAPTIPFAARYGEISARVQGDAERLVKWLRVRREASSDPIERAVDLVRESLLVADEDMSLAASLLAEAIKARPADIGLRELHERLATDSGGDRGAWRVEAAEHCDGPTKLRLLVEAAREYERSGDVEGAARAALAALEASNDPYAELLFERVAPLSSLSPRLGERLLARARETEDAREQRELYERLSQLDDVRGDHSSALLWQSAILERSPTALMALRRIEHTYIGAGREDELEPIAATLAREIDPNEAAAHSWLAARLRSRAGNWDGARDVIELAAKHASPPLWALRAQSAHARAAGDDAVAFEADKRLSMEMTQPADAATLLLRASEAAARLGKLGEAKELVNSACELVPNHLVAFTTRAEVLEALGDHVGAAESYEKVAELCAVSAHRFGAWREAGVLWQDRINEPERAERALAHAAEIEPRDFDVFDRLRRLYVATGDRSKLAALLEQRLGQTSNPEERLALEVTRARALTEIGDLPAARAALGAALEAAPEHVEALDAYADVCAADGDWTAAEQAWIRLARQVNDPERQVALYNKLGELYDGALPNPERAEVAYNEVLKHKPNDLATIRKLLQVYGKLGKSDQALGLAQGMLDKAASDDEKRDRMILLSVVLEQVVADKKKAEQTLEKARRTWPHDVEVLRAQVAFHQRNGEERAVNMLLDRAATDSRRALGTGRFDAAFFRTIAAAAELRGATDAAAVAQKTLAAIEGGDAALPGAGTAASDTSIDDLLAPELLSGAFRALLHKSGDALDAAYALDTKAMRAGPAPGDSAEFVGEVQSLASAFGLDGVEVLVSPMLGTACTALASTPPRLVVGSALIEAPDPGIRTFLVLRALKILQARAATVARTAPIELWPMVAGWLSIFAPSWTPQGVDAAKAKAARDRIQAAITRPADGDAGTLALEITGSIGNRASQLGTAVNQWANRVALLAIGDLSIGLNAIAAAGGHGPPPADGADRMKWIVRNSEARDLAVFCVSDAYVEVRRRFGL